MVFNRINVPVGSRPPEDVLCLKGFSWVFTMVIRSFDGHSFKGELRFGHSSEYGGLCYFEPFLVLSLFFSAGGFRFVDDQSFHLGFFLGWSAFEGFRAIFSDVFCLAFGLPPAFVVGSSACVVGFFWIRTKGFYGLNNSKRQTTQTTLSSLWQVLIPRQPSPRSGPTTY